MYLYAVKTIRENSGPAEELVSNCFIKLWENRKKIIISVSLKHYLYVMLYHEITDYYRKKRLLTEKLTDDFVAPFDEKEFDHQQQYARLYQAVKKLPEQCRKVLELAVYDSMSYNDIANKLNISKNTVKTQIGRAYRQLKEMLDPNDFIFFLTLKIK